jgi:hypothetical protein
MMALGRVQELGWGVTDSGRMQDEGKWTPIFFNTDRVPEYGEGER